MKKYWGIFVVIALLGPLAVGFLPLFYMCFLITLVIVPPLAYFSHLGDYRKAHHALPLTVIMQEFVSYMICFPLVLFMITALFRSLLIMIYGLHPLTLSIVNDLHNTVIYDHAIPVFGELFPYWLDVYWGIAGVVVLFTMALFDMVRRNRLVRQIEILPTSKCHAAAIGLVELKGKVVPHDADHKGPIILSQLSGDKEGTYSTYTESHPFYINDGTGQILVDPRGSNINTTHNIFEINLYHTLLKSSGIKDPKNKILEENRLMPGEEVYVLGNLQINSDPEFASDKVIIKPQKSSLKGFQIYDLFFLSNTSEAELIEAFRKAIKRGWIGVFLLMLIPLWLAMYGWTNVTQLKAQDINAAPAVFRWVTYGTVYEREIKVDDLGAFPIHYWFEQLRQGHENTEDIIQAFNKQHLHSVIIPVLQEVALDIDHPTFGIVHGWLQQLDAEPDGYWGHEYIKQRKAEKFITENNSFLTRVLLQYDNQKLTASYRAYFGPVIIPGFVLIKRYIVFELTHQETGTTQRIEIPADDGWNKPDPALVFENISPGKYSVFIHPGREYENGRTDRGSRAVKKYIVTF